MQSAEYAAFQEVVRVEIDRFTTSALPRRVDAGAVELRHYHAILCTLFHQTYAGPYSFARAAVRCEWKHEAAKDYLLRHAEEERSHWRWVLDDLAATGYAGTSPRALPPHPTCMAFVGLQGHLAEYHPVARLASAAVLEGIGARFGGRYGARMLQALQLEPRQATFFLSHGETDKLHSVELTDVLDQCRLTPEEWVWMNYAASVTAQFYCAMYSHEAFQ